MRKSIVLCFALLLAVMAGCARKVNKDWVPTGGSRADATMELSYQYNPNTEIPVIDDQQGRDLAIARCRAWGYRSAEPFSGSIIGGAISTCNETVHAGLAGPVCISRLVTKQYQCLGRGSEAPTSR